VRYSKRDREEAAQIAPSAHDIAHHERVKADAMSGAPQTEDGKGLLASLRPWPGVGHVGECGGCKSSLLIPLQPPRFFDPRIPDRIWARIMPEPMSGCWLWVGASSERGYGALWDVAIASKRRAVIAHRYVYTTLVGPAEGLDIDHLCRTHACVNPAHLEAVPHQVNCQRGNVGWNSRAKVCCPSGHPYDETNTYVVPSTGERTCRTCRKNLRRPQVRSKEQKAKRREDYRLRRGEYRWRENGRSTLLITTEVEPCL